MSNVVLRLTRKALRNMLRETESAQRSGPKTPSQDEYDAVSAEFDHAFYLLRYPDVASAGMDPVLHYMLYGWKERRDPRADFSTSSYLERHADVARAGMNPFLHYIRTGRTEGRSMGHPLGPKAEVLARLEPIDARIARWTRTDAPPAPLGVDEIRKALSAGLETTTAGLILCIAHDDYAVISGGTQASIRIEEAEALRAGFAYLGVWPWQALPCLSIEHDPLVELRLNGQPLGAARISDLTAAAAETPVSPGRAQLIVHSLLGHDPDRVRVLAGAFGLASGWYWLHDYFGICTSYTLQRNDLAYCGAPPPQSAACGICIHGAGRAAQTSRLRALFDGLAMTVVSPSEAALAIWSRASALRTAASVVHPHLQLVYAAKPDSPGAEPAAPDQGAPVRLAFLGATVAHKGWDDYLRLAGMFNGTPGREFHYFGHYANVPAHIQRTEVTATGDRPDAMLHAVRAAGIDVFVNWPAWPETFSYTTFEAIGAGAVVLTNQISGNVAAAVRSTGKGRVFETFDQLAAFVASPGLTRLVADARAARATEEAKTQRSRMTIDLLPRLGTG